MKVRETLLAFDAYLVERGLRFDAIVIGGSALNLLGVVSRQTKDCDIHQQDANPGWPAHVHNTLSELAQRLGYGI
jgi:hypothetical protein